MPSPNRRPFEVRSDPFKSSRYSLCPHKKRRGPIEFRLGPDSIAGRVLVSLNEVRAELEVFYQSWNDVSSSSERGMSFRFPRGPSRRADGSAGVADHASIAPVYRDYRVADPRIAAFVHVAARRCTQQSQADHAARS